MTQTTMAVPHLTTAFTRDLAREPAVHRDSAGSRELVLPRDVVLIGPDLHAAELTAPVLETRHALELEEARRTMRAQIEHQGVEIQRLQAQLARHSHTAGRWLADMSAELCTPLNAVIGFAQLLDGELFGPLTEKQREFVRHIQTDGRLLRGRLDELLDLSCVEAGLLPLAPVPTSPGLLLAAVVGVLRPVAAERRVQLVVALDDAAHVLADRTRLRQAMHLFLSRAVQQSPTGGRVDVRVSRQDGVIELRIAAIGMDAGPPPTGPGQVLAQRLIEAHGGRAEWQPGPPPALVMRLPAYDPLSDHQARSKASNTQA